MNNVDGAGATPTARSAALEEVWRSIDARIAQGALSGNGADKTAERNGLVLAANIVRELIDATGVDSGDGGQK